MIQKRYRLLARAQLDGEVRQPGYVFTLAAGERGPHKAVVASNALGHGVAPIEGIDAQFARSVTLMQSMHSDNNIIAKANAAKTAKLRGETVH